MNIERPPHWVVMKFGGTSVSSVDCWKTICGEAARRAGSGQAVLIVVSALSGVTNLLTRLADGADQREKKEIHAELKRRHRRLFEGNQLQASSRFQAHWVNLERLLEQAGQPLSPRKRALLLAHGELLSSSIGERVLQSAGLKPVWQDARKLLRTSPKLHGEYLSARCDDDHDPALGDALLKQGEVHITQGFIAADQDGSTCLLGRGGSDTSAAYLAARVGASALEIWTDVPGIFSADPRTVPDARLLNLLSYSEAQELASMGAKVLHPPSIQPARNQGIPVSIKDTQHPSEPGTLISARSLDDVAQVKGVVSRDNITVITMDNPSMWHQAGFLADAFAVFKQHGYSVDLVSTSESTVTVSLDPQLSAHGDEIRMAAFLEDLGQLCRVTVHTACTSISLVGNAIRTILGRLSAAFDLFHDRHIYMVTQSANDLNFTLVIDSEHAGLLVQELHQALIATEADRQPAFGPRWSDLTGAR